jgi:hypothetical protein
MNRRQTMELIRALEVLAGLSLAAVDWAAGMHWAVGEPEGTGHATPFEEAVVRSLAFIALLAEIAGHDGLASAALTVALAGWVESLSVQWLLWSPSPSLLRGSEDGTEIVSLLGRS